MLKQLRISNIILIENADIAFDKGLNILTGETGAGKSSVLQALTLALGERAESSIIRKDTPKAFIEASFEIPQESNAYHLLDEAGIEYDKASPLVIRREIAAGGKNRSFINDQIASLSLIEMISTSLIDMVGQHSHQRLLSLNYHREVLDAFAKHHQLQDQVKSAWEHEVKIRSQLEELTKRTPERLREIDICKMELEELQDARLREGEEEDLFQEYSRLSHAEEIVSKAKDITSALIEGRTPILPLLNKQKMSLEHIVSLDTTLHDTLQSFQNCLIELEEAAYTLSRYQEKLESDPTRLSIINERLGLINRLKRKYGQTLEDIQQYQLQLKCKLEELQKLDDLIPELKEDLKKAEEAGITLSTRLSKSREQAAIELEKLITEEIRSLNMPKATFHIKLSPQPRGANGVDKIECCFSPNVGEQMISLRECASGGELSRILLAIKCVLAGRDQVPTLIFDEIDANLGGETASIVGDKLHHLGRQYQVLCITHLPQVASRGEHHYQIFKEEKQGRTVAQLVKLDKKARHQELTRMLGGISFSTATQELAEKILRN